jgi:hypothetical protein
MKTTLSLGRSYSEKVADNLIKLRRYAITHGIENKFLDYVSTYRDDFGVLRITFKGGVNLNASDTESLVKGFMNLSKFEIVDGAIEYDPTKVGVTSNIQKSLLNYAIINYGLQFSSSNYSNYISATKIKEIDEVFESKLLEVVNSARDKDQRYASLVNQFSLVYAVKQGSRLPFVPSERMQPYAAVNTPTADGVKTTRIYQGVDKVGEAFVYYDRKVKQDANERPATFIKIAFSNRVSVYKLVLEADNYAYYQVVGKTSDIFFSPLPSTDMYGKSLQHYSMQEYFNPFELTMTYSDLSAPLSSVKVGDKLKVTSMLSLFNEEGKDTFIKIGDEFWISPAYNADRTSRLRVKLTAAPSQASGSKKGYIYSVEVVKPSKARAQPISNSRVSYQNYITREDVLSNPDTHYLFGDSLLQRGRMPQASKIRDLANTVSIPVKKLPNSSAESFFTDEELDINKAYIDEAFNRIPPDVDVVVPALGLTAGLGKLAEKAPLTFEYLESKLQELAAPKPMNFELDAEAEQLDKLENKCND